MKARKGVPVAKKKYIYFHFLPVDYRGVQRWLEEQAERGWELEGFCWPCIGKFRPVEREDLRYFVDVTDQNVDGTQGEPGYLELCQEAGWTLCLRVGQLHIFKSTPGRTPVPIHTDEALEWERVRKKVVRPTMRNLAVVLGMQVLNIWLQRGQWADILTGGAYPGQPLILAFCLIMVAWLELAAQGILLLRCRLRGAPPRDPTGRAARVRGWLEGAVFLLLFVVLAVLLIIVIIDNGQLIIDN